MNINSRTIDNSRTLYYTRRPSACWCFFCSVRTLSCRLYTILVKLGRTIIVQLTLRMYHNRQLQIAKIIYYLVNIDKLILNVLPNFINVVEKRQWIVRTEQKKKKEAKMLCVCALYEYMACYCIRMIITNIKIPFTIYLKCSSLAPSLFTLPVDAFFFLNSAA